MHYYKRNLGDYSKKAGRLSMLQHGAYTLLIDACYDREMFPTKKEAMAWAWASTPDEVVAVEFVLARFFSLDDIGRYVQSRIEEELIEYRELIEKQKKNGKKGGRPKGKSQKDAGSGANNPHQTQNNPHQTQNNPVGFENNPVGTQPQATQSLTTNQEPRTKREEKVEKENPPAAASGGGVVDFNRRFGQDVFAMTADWQPSESFGDRAEMCGLPDSALDQHAFGEFKSYWSAHPEAVNSNDAWEHKLIGSLKRASLQDDLIEEQRKNAKTPRTDKTAHDQSILDAIVGGPRIW